MKGVFAAVADADARRPLDRPRRVRRALPAAARRGLPRPRRSSAPPARRTRSRSASASRRWEALVEDGIPADVLLPGTGACALPDAVTLAQAALALGAPGVLALPPFYYKGVSDDGLFRFFAELIERVGDDRLRAVPLPHPAAGGGRLLARADRPAARRLPGHDRRHQGLRGRRRRGSSAICKEFPQLTVFAGSERFLLDTLRWGGDGCISATVNVTARQARDVYDLLRGRLEDADAAQAALTEAPPVPRRLPG